MAEVKIQIDGQTVIAESGQTILEVARSLGKQIPTLCHDPRLAPFSSCFVCLVEVEGARGFVPSCATKIAPGMVVRTETPEIRAARKTALELIVSNHFADCLGPCTLTCPAGVDIQGYIALLAMGRYREAVALIKETNPLPSICGRVCTRPCESKCRRNLTGDPVGIDYLKRYAADLDRECGHPFTPPVKPPTGHRVAVVGAGPAGLTAAYYLALEGHEVKIFEAREKAGGWLMYGIPEYRLPEEVMDYEAESIFKLGVEIETNTALGRDFSVDDLFDRGYEAIFIGIGAQKSTLMRIPGENAPNVISGIDFLEKANHGDITELKGRAIVVGGGNTAVDAARTALRLGAESVTMVYRRSRAEMPAHHQEIDDMEKEGVKLELLTNPLRYNLGEDGKVMSITCIRMALGEPDASGRRRPVPVEGSDFEIETEWIFSAIGQQADNAPFNSSRCAFDLKMTKWGTVDVTPETMGTSVSRLYAGGDMVTGAATAIEAIAAGKKAAMAIHRRLSGETILRLVKPFISRKDTLRPNLRPEDLPAAPDTARQHIPALGVEDRIRSFVEVELGYSAEQASEEVKRCLECGCTAFFECDLQKWCSEYDVNQGAFSGDFHDEKPVEDHPFLRFDLSKCILCGRCVRLCDEVVGAAALGFVRRGFDAGVRPALEKPLTETTCIACGQCAETCPTGAITVKPDSPKPGPFKLQGTPSVCGFCSVGCGVTLETVGERVVRVTSNPDSPVTPGGNLCRNGRFGFQVLNSEHRLVSPLVRKAGVLAETSWEEAFETVAGLARPVLENFGPEAFGVLAGGRLTCEEAYLAQKFARTTLKTPNVYCLSMAAKPALKAFYHDLPGPVHSRIATADLVLVLGVDTLDNYPVMEFKIHEAARGGKSNVFLFNENGGFTGRVAQRWVPLEKRNLGAFTRALLAEALSRFAPHGNVVGLSDLRHHLDGVQGMDTLRKLGLSTTDVNTLLDKLFTGRPAIVFDLETAGEEAALYLYDLCILMENRGRHPLVYAMAGQTNSRGVLEMGCHPDWLPGWRPAGDPAVRNLLSAVWGTGLPEPAGLSSPAFVEAIRTGKVRGLFSFAEDILGCPEAGQALADAFRHLKCVVSVDLFRTETAEHAHVILPMAAFTENEGTVMNMKGRFQRVRAAVPNRAGMPTLEVIGGLGLALGADVYPGRLEALWKEMGSVMPRVPRGGFGALDTRGSFPPEGRTANLPFRLPSPRSRETALRNYCHVDSLFRHWNDRLAELGLTPGT